jgi:hypothetical protein
MGDMLKTPSEIEVVKQFIETEGAARNRTRQEMIAYNPKKQHRYGAETKKKKEEQEKKKQEKNKEAENGDDDWGTVESYWIDSKGGLHEDVDTFFEFSRKSKLGPIIDPRMDSMLDPKFPSRYSSGKRTVSGVGSTSAGTVADLGEGPKAGRGTSSAPRSSSRKEPTSGVGSDSGTRLGSETGSSSGDVSDIVGGSIFDD